MNDRGITGGRLPWVITSGSGEVDRQGNVEVKVTGLVVSADGSTNPVAHLRATVSCLTPHGVVNVTTSAFPASSAGDAAIDGLVDLPHPCKDPIVFIVNGNASVTGAFAWLAMSNAEDLDWPAQRRRALRIASALRMAKTRRQKPCLTRVYRNRAANAVIAVIAR